MQQQPRLVPPGNVGSGAGQRSGAAPASVPQTPRKKGEELDSLLLSLEEQYHLGFRIDTDWSSPARRRTPADGVSKKIQFLYYSHRPALIEALDAFANVATFIAKQQQLEALSSILRSKTHHGTPVSRSRTPINATNVPSKSLKTSQPRLEDTPRSRGLFDNYSHDTAAILREALPDPGSPTDEDEDEDDFVTPPSPRESSRSPSPSVTSKSAKRRVEASSHISLQRTSRKRPSNSSVENGKPKKLTKASQGEQPFQKPQLPAVVKNPSQFKRPSLDMARSVNVLPASQSTVNTSFNTVSSSQQTGIDTANTSFTSDAEHTEIPHAFTAKASSIKIGQFDDRDFLTINEKLTNDAAIFEKRPEPSSSSSQGRDSSSTWGSSLPEEELLAASARVESSHHVSPVRARRLSPQRPGQQVGGSQPAPSPIKNQTFANSKTAAQILNQSFPPPPGVSAMLSPERAASRPKPTLNGVTPARHQQRPSREQTPVESPSKIAHHIRNIPRQGLFVDESPSSLRAMPYFALFICQRIALERSVPLAELTQNMDVAQACAEPGVFWETLLEHPNVAYIKFKDSDRLWSAAKRSFEGFTFKGQINLRTRQTGPVFQLDLHPILPDKSCRFQRKFGADRFLYLNVPDLETKSWNGGNKDDLKSIRERWTEWLHAEHSFLFRKWRVFHIEPMKKAKTKGRNAEVTHKLRIILFATEGHGIEQKSTIGAMLNWFLPFAENQHQSFCKAYARFDLGLSRTTPTLVFKPSQIEFVPDTIADGAPEAIEFNDPLHKWPRISGGQVMNDGCSIMSVGAALEIWKIFKKFWSITGPLPCAFQGRIGGAKGLWMISEDSFTKDPYHLAVWIKISKSQLKFEPHPDDLCDDSFDPLRLTFEVSNYSTSPVQSDLHISFIPIMADRGVPRDVIADFMTERLDADRTELLERLTNPVKLYEYVHKKSAVTRQGSEMAWQGALPLALDDKIKLLLEAGFSPLELQVLAKHVSRFVKRQHLLQESKLKTPLGKATFLFGVADPVGVLKPGEIHVQFSSAFVDDLTDEKYMNLKGHNILVARQPAIRNSDIQKVRAVLHPALSHLVDLVVFPSTGQFPLAGKLQGGDYDGDIFWLCWEDRLVAPFKNAPAPVESPDPEQYGIRVNKQTLNDLKVDARDEASIDGFLQRAYVFRSASSLLGIVTNYLVGQSYKENRLSSFRLDHLGNMHDLLVDASKQGYTFTLTDWHYYLKKHLQCNPNSRQPIYKDAMDACAAVKDSGAAFDKIREKTYKFNADHIIDYLYFEIVAKHNISTMKKIQTTLSSATEADEDLVYPRKQLASLKDQIIDEEIRKAQEDMELLYRSWNANSHKDEKTTNFEEFGKVVDELYERFKAIKPSNTDHPTIKSWLHPWIRPDFCMWDRLRASILYDTLPKVNTQTFVFQMAGDELAKIKAERYPHTRSIVAEIRANMKPKPIRALIQDDDDEDDEDDASALEQMTT